MNLTTFTDYSLRVLMYLGAQPGRRSTIAEIAGSFGVSEHHLTKVVHFLGKNGWLANVRGRGGGLELAMAPAGIRIGDVVRQTEGGPIVECFGKTGGNCTISPCCQLAGVLSEAVNAFHAVLDRYTLADIVANREELATVMFLQRRA
ncbi:MAG: Rrf2 family transcriptional regulator [Burkholderiales bacterium]|nr:Rrf2 family transcriptional regulator [Burkholderiales bacterium]